MHTLVLSEEQNEILDYIDKSNNEIAEDFSNKKSKEKWYKNTSEMYIAELYEMKEKIKYIWEFSDGWWTPELIKERRAINNEIEKVVWIKKNNGAMYILNEIRWKGNDVYLQ